MRYKKEGRMQMSKANDPKYIVKFKTDFDGKWHQQTIYVADAWRYARKNGIEKTKDAAMRMVWCALDDAGISCGHAMTVKYIGAKPNKGEDLAHYLGRALLPPQY